MLHFLKGLIIGFSIAAPVGPVGLLCIRRSMNEGRLAGFITGLGAATADAIYGLIAALGLTAVTQALLSHRGWFQFGGGVFMVLVGVATLRARPATAPADARSASSLPLAFLWTLALTLTNPMTMLGVVGIFAGLGVGVAMGDTWAGGLLVAGVFFGSALWWLILSSAAGWLGARLQHGGLRGLNIAAGSIIGAFGVWQLVGLLRL